MSTRSGAKPWALGVLCADRAAVTLSAGPLPASLPTCNDLVVLDLHNNALSGTLEDFAFQTC